MRDSYVGEDSRAATYARAIFKEWDKGQDLYLMSIRRQLPINTGLADLWVALYVQRMAAGGHEVEFEVPARVELLRYFEFPFARLAAGASSGKVASEFSNHDQRFSCKGFMTMFQIHNADVSLDPIPQKLRACVPESRAGGGLAILVLMAASGRSGSVVDLMRSQYLDAYMGMDWAQSTVDALRYKLMSPDVSSHVDALRLAEGTTSEVPMTSKVNHVSFGVHTDWIRMVIDLFPSWQELLKDYMTTFRALKGIDGIGAFRAVHIAAWLFIAFGRQICVGDEHLEVLFGPDARLFDSMCSGANTFIKVLYREVAAIVPDMNPVTFQIWNCKFINFVFVLRMEKQASLAWRRTLTTVAGSCDAAAYGAVGRRLTSKVHASLTPYVIKHR